ncbi:MAG: hypothetical protein A3C85_00410 [Candidatus Doudnabacteria bacterium RIFCSPHIGHO2_02_FULL_48_21]|uniref:Glycosyl transferase family 1 domain-containing protein n=1 Tax=Candidatus Doudnabacteria bacterium RIFCSPLOWO2_02_FULL_48_13 TaxID=1817845 RepID=A0A1F5QCN6_9BACT|nr:MAG: hypothetical protein A3K05_01130 [Candidatus Doudnabacteria bacterium RIFCSPHIGHO2_01_48_18]OGE79177.1 MAG: hypothetical protein A2668_00360 [Candidatus Doudnabacteria bacterium RIFCSPHIGHO2_01_FULL_48_180]OGE91809.1 MAG: hypothetical protein A3F44_00920 [Candidatus Doudnabacteria bacterium RIFCSPHIGHO2_12_FULL_47_25]OGE93659.1 MAG: hypothetical protein A3C85_00410 [Candidatus Doudnabacteria bacterium RIFCSPHIGHO2_02_FULL_48_21]OGE97940.1 MAG: hypothetical protein A3A83_00595 [Candidatu
MLLGIDASQANRKNRTGTEWYAFYLLEEFKHILGGKEGIRVRLYTRDALQSDIANNLPDNFEVHILRWPFRFFWGQLRLSAEMLALPPDVLFCPAHTIPLVHPGKTYTTLHDVGFKDYPELYDKPSLWYHQFSAKLAVKKAVKIFTVSDFSKNRIMQNYSVPAERITVTYLGFDQSKYHTLERQVSEKTAAEFGLKYKQFFLYVGRIEPKKNLLRQIEGYEMSGTNFPFVIAGRKVDTRDVDSYLEKRPELKAKIRFLDYISEQDKIALYCSASALLFATLYEGFGLPIVEAQACGTPVITSNTASNAEIAGQGALIVHPDSPHEIGQAISKVISDNNLREQLISFGFENNRRFNWRQTALLTLEQLLTGVKN